VRRSQGCRLLSRIPVFGVPVLNKYHLLQRMFDSIDYPIDRLYIIDNGGELDREAIRWPWDVHRIHVADYGYNTGVAGGWNHIIRANSGAPWWCIANNDVVLEPGALARLFDAMESDSPTLARITMGNERSWGNHFGAFGLNASFVDTVGWFDENIIPIYWEDTDYINRIEVLRRQGVVLNLPIIESPGTHHDGNQSWKTGQSDDALAPQNKVSWDGNVKYYDAKKAAIDKGEASVVHWPQPSIERIRALDWQIPRRDNVRSDSG
jgi:hypothetical protein